MDDDDDVELDVDFALVDLIRVVTAEVGLLVAAFEAGMLRTCPGSRSLTEILGFAASRAASETPCSSAILNRVSPN